MERGDVHIDWIISMSIFLLFTFLLFLFFRPLDIAPRDKHVLLDHLIERFEHNFTWEVKKIPLFVRACEYFINNEGVPTDMTIDFLLNDWIIGNVSYKKGNVFYSWTNFEDIICPTTGEDLVNKHFNIPSSGSEAVFYYTYYHNSQFPPKPIVSAQCSSSIPDHCDFSFGSTETFFGIREGAALEELRNQNNYFHVNNIKENWNFPNSNEFWIISQDISLDYKTTSPYPNTNIVVREVKTFVIDEKGERRPAFIIFKVW